VNQEIKDKWIADLRSGEYRQGHGYLCVTRADGTTEYCCLGVLCVQAEAAGVIGSTRTQEIRQFDDNPDERESVEMTRFDGIHNTYLPGKVVRWAGLDKQDPEIPSQGRRLSALNDDGISFDSIADLIGKWL
jgi:hypothetical protein